VPEEFRPLGVSTLVLLVADVLVADAGLLLRRYIGYYISHIQYQEISFILSKSRTKKQKSFPPDSSPTTWQKRILRCLPFGSEAVITDRYLER